jgi:uncharacterized SAM-binding protein YcdF (DUF218 family)
MEFTWLKLLVKVLVLPPGGPLLVAFSGFGIAKWRPKAGRALVALGVVSLTLLCMPAVGAFLMRGLDRSPPLDTTKLSGAQAIVILGGGMRSHAPEYGGPTMNTLTLERVRYGARLARITGLPLLVSGGTWGNGPPEAIVMRDALVNEFKLPVRWIEARSRNTHQNALYSAKILKANGIGRVILVGHRFDFPRSRAEFQAAGVEIVAAPMGVTPTEIDDFIPTVHGLSLSYYALYELLANVMFHLQH